MKVLNQYQFSSKLYLIPFLDIQKEISQKSEDARSRVVLYRRFMMRIAEHIAKKEGYHVGKYRGPNKRKNKRK